jgi:hypothetical protein
MRVMVRFSSALSLGRLRPPLASERIAVATPPLFICSMVASRVQRIATGAVRMLSFFQRSCTNGGNMW